METTHPNYGLTKSREEEVSAEEQFINPLPRAVLRPNQFILLDGEWRFSLDMDDLGLAQQWYIGHHYEYTAHWPGSIEEHMVEAKGLQSDNTWQDKVIGWYEREFPLPELSSNNG